MLQVHWHVNTQLRQRVKNRMLPQLTHHHGKQRVCSPARPHATARCPTPHCPRSFLLIQGRQYEALQVLRHMAASNGTTLPDHLKLMPMTRHDSDSGQLALIAQKQPSSSSWQAVKEGTHLAAAQLRLLFRPPLLGCTLPLLVAWVGLCGGWYSTVLWIPEYFKRRGAEGSSMYAETFAVALANLPGNIASLYMVDRLGRRLTCCLCLAGACIAALLFAQAPAHGAWPLVAACFFNGISVGGWNSLDVVTTELYPTAVRASGMGLLGAAGRWVAAGGGNCCRLHQCVVLWTRHAGTFHRILS